MQELEALALSKRLGSPKRVELCYSGVGDLYNLEGNLVKITIPSEGEKSEYYLSLPVKETDDPMKCLREAHHRNLLRRGKLRTVLAKLSSEDLQILGISHLV